MGILCSNNVYDMQSRAEEILRGGRSENMKKKILPFKTFQVINKSPEFWGFLFRLPLPPLDTLLHTFIILSVKFN